MNSRISQAFTRLLTKWPLDVSKQGRDLGEHLRKTFANSLVRNSTDSEVSKQLAHIEEFEKIANNQALKKYTRIYSSSATGLGAKECKEIVSTKFLAELNKK